LVFDSAQVGAVSYPDLRIAIAQTRFIEDSSVPPDSQIVDHTWRYVNKKGGPDRRFSDNRELPILLYDEVRLTSSTGLNEVIQTSKVGAAVPLRDAVAVISTGATAA